jgi:hypothetical protein
MKTYKRSNRPLYYVPSFPTLHGCRQRIKRRGRPFVRRVRLAGHSLGVLEYGERDGGAEAAWPIFHLRVEELAVRNPALFEPDGIEAFV